MVGASCEEKLLGIRVGQFTASAPAFRLVLEQGSHDEIGGALFQKLASSVKAKIQLAVLGREQCPPRRSVHMQFATCRLDGGTVFSVREAPAEVASDRMRNGIELQGPQNCRALGGEARVALKRD